MTSQRQWSTLLYPFLSVLFLGLGALLGAPKAHPGITFAHHIVQKKRELQHACEISETNQIGRVEVTCYTLTNLYVGREPCA